MFGNDWKNLITNNTKSTHQKTFYEELETDEKYAGITLRVIYLLFKNIGNESKIDGIFVEGLS
jgi:hypothetical protein